MILLKSENRGRWRKIVLAIVLIFSVGIVSAISKKERDSILNLPMFKKDDLLKYELKGDLISLLNDVGEDRSYHKCKLTSLNERNTDHPVLDVKVKTRGNFRRRKQNCNFPPLRFKFSHKESTGTVFEGQSKLKYVSHCQSLNESYEQHTIEEYLIYKMYNLVSDHSYRTRLLQMSFVDVNTNDTLVKYGFFIEDKDDVATRCGKSVLNFKNIKQYDILRKNMVMLSLFQLMIGNSDWDVSRLHNIDILAVSENSIPMVVPFDFDWSGIINHDYYTLSPTISPDAKYKRMYKGMNWGDEDLEAAFEDFRELKMLFLKIITDCEYLKDENKNRLVAYIEEFYQLIGSKKDVRNEIVKKSQKLPSNK